jgi:two-component system sensor histidine kinase HydH
MTHTMLATKTMPPGPESLTELSHVLQRFTESSSKLEGRYAALMDEVQELRRQLVAKEEEIKRAERLSMLGETAAALAHEVRNPLGAITLFLSMLKADMRDRPNSLTLVEEIEKSITSLNGVVSNVLHFAKNNAVQRSPMNVHSLLHEVVQHFMSVYGAQANFVLNTRGNPFIVGDEQALRQVLYNLFINSLQSTAFAGVVEVEVFDEGDDGSVSLIVRDNGPGIPEAIMPRLFEPFASGRREGTGLGLSIVRRIIEAHGGSICARNVPGAEFVITLPRSARS